MVESSTGFLHDGRIESASSLAELGALVLSTSDPLSKSRLSHLAFSRWSQKRLPIGVSEAPPPPSRPPEPKLVRFFMLYSGGCISLPVFIRNFYSVYLNLLGVMNLVMLRFHFTTFKKKCYFKNGL